MAFILKESIIIDAIVVVVVVVVVGVHVYVIGAVQNKVFCACACGCARVVGGVDFVLFDSCVLSLLPLFFPLLFYVLLLL